MPTLLDQTLDALTPPPLRIQSHAFLVQSSEQVFFHVDVKMKERFNYFNLKLFMSIFI